MKPMDTQKPSGIGLEQSMPITNYSPEAAASGSRVIGLLLLYSASYSERSIHLFSKLLNAIHKENTLIIILNQSLVMPHFDHADIHIINGDNHLREFSGWNAGIKYCRQNNLIPNNGIIIFGNDTFCHHNKYGIITQLVFANVFKKVLKKCNKLLISGEVQCSSVDLRIFSLKFQYWISTYLYAMTIPLLNEIKGVVPDVELNQCFHSSTSSSGSGFFTHHVNQPLAKKLLSWLFGTGGNAKWHGAQALTEANYSMMVGKSKSILCEMHLSAMSVHVGAQLVPVFKSGFMRQLRRLERLL
jgi:hypothetical protein